MKHNIKKIVALFSVASLLFLGACSDKPSNGTDIKNETVEVAVDDFTAEFIFGENGLIEKEKLFYDNQEVTYEYYECYEYNENGQITKRFATDLEGNILEKHDLFEITYNKDGKIEKITEDDININFDYNDDGSLKGYTKLEDAQTVNSVNYEYDENGNKIKETLSNATGENVSETVYTYNESDLVLSSVTKSKNGDITNETSHEYNADGLITKLIREVGTETRTTVYEYRDGILEKETMTASKSVNSADTRKREYVTTYEYFAEGNVVKFSRARNGEVYITDVYSADEAKGNFAELENYISL